MIRPTGEAWINALKNPYVGYVDGDWASCTIDRKSKNGGFIELWNMLVHWFTESQTNIAKSSIQSEFKAYYLHRDGIRNVLLTAHERQMKLKVNDPNFWSDH